MYRRHFKLQADLTGKGYLHIMIKMPRKENQEKVLKASREKC
jgi:hypothetical protein